VRRWLSLSFSRHNSDIHLIQFQSVKEFPENQEEPSLL
jgi:hypothetical protein